VVRPIPPLAARTSANQGWKDTSERAAKHLGRLNCGLRDAKRSEAIARASCSRQGTVGYRAKKTLLDASQTLTRQSGNTCRASVVAARPLIKSKRMVPPEITAKKPSRRRCEIKFPAKAHRCMRRESRPKRCWALPRTRQAGSFAAMPTKPAATAGCSKTHSLLGVGW
jgi:hypothetical protein